MPRSAKVDISALEVAGEGGMGMPKGMTRVMSQSPRTPRAVRWSCRSSAASLGAGGHLNGWEQTPTMA